MGKILDMIFGLRQAPAPVASEPAMPVASGGKTELEKVEWHIARYERAIAQQTKPERKAEQERELAHWRRLHAVLKGVE